MDTQVDLPPRPGFWRRLWRKYGLIVVGNVVFFALLYWFSYRPHNAQSRAGEFLSVAQQMEADGRLEAAEVLYDKVLQDYAETDAARTAGRRMPEVKQARALSLQRLAAPQPPPELQIRKLIDGPPAWFLATLLAGHYASVAEADRPRYFEALDGYLRTALDRGEIDHARAKAHPAFAHDALARRYFDLKAACTMASDWVWDDVRVRNDNLFAWSGAVIELEVVQGERRESGSVRLDRVRPGESVEVTELRIKADGGEVRCKARIDTTEGGLRFEQRL